MKQVPAKTPESAGMAAVPLILLPFLGSGFVPTDSMPAALATRGPYYLDNFRRIMGGELIDPVDPETAALLGGAVLTETTFNWPGIGHALVVYLENRDYIAVQGLVGLSRPEGIETGAVPTPAFVSVVPVPVTLPLAS